jgi:hypothetical protein
MASVAEMPLEKRHKATAATIGTLVPTNGIEINKPESISRETNW